MQSLMDRSTARTAVLIIFWFIFNIMTVILNKYIFQTLSWVFPIALTVVHMITCTIGAILILRVLQWKTIPFIQLDWQKYSRGAVPLAVLFCTNIVLGNVSLRWVPVSFMQTVKSSVPFFTVVLERMFFWEGGDIDRRVDLSLVPIVGGVAMASYYEVNFNWTGFLAALVASVITALMAIMSSRLLRTKMDGVNLLYYMSPLSIVMLTPFVFTGEWEEITADWILRENGSFLLTILIISGAGAFMLNISQFLLIKNTSALTFTVAGNCKVVINIALSVMIFRNQVTFLNGFGCILTVLGASYYQQVRYEINQNNQQRQQAPREPDVLPLVENNADKETERP
eukprot:TRINITY_DN5075_c0_g1_i2.p1 TRINITY_DN5075_c0_g1~~TRINITY_DN5075_c0_g1_i2.p1  ORF type:complete len:341 (+),score=60.68 TRINITY_DN5075_c0_g1_i2:96-1118(+)